MNQIANAGYAPGDVLPTEVEATLPEDFASGFHGQPGFSGLGPGLEKTGRVLRGRYGSPRLLAEKTPGGNVLCFIRFDAEAAAVAAVVSDRETLALYPVEESYAALPQVFQSYYRWLEGLQLLPPDGQPSLAWKNLPCAYNGRLELSDLAGRARLPADAIQALYSRFGSKSLQAWIRCDGGDVFFADEYNRRGRLYHFRTSDVTNVSVVTDDGFLDEYVSFVLGGNDPATFDFGAWLAPAAP